MFQRFQWKLFILNQLNFLMASPQSILSFLFINQYSIMDPTSSQQNLFNTHLCWGYTYQEILTVTAIFVVIIAALKSFFRGGQFKVPKIDLTGKYAVVTGGNSGIGAETVKELCKLGCEVIIGARSKSTAEEVIKDIRRANPSAKVQFVPLDLASRASIESFVSAVTFPRIDYLVNNAGIMAIPTRKTTKQGVEMQWGVNHLGHFYLTSLLWGKVTASPAFRVINVSSLAHKSLSGFGPEPKPDWANIDFETNYHPGVSYSRSKLYNVLFTRALAEKITGKGIVVSLHPGVVRTDLMREIQSDGIKGFIIKTILRVSYPIWWLASKSAHEGCQTTLFTLFSDNVQNGQYYADCNKSKMNSYVTKENWNQLWEISEKRLGIKFSP